MKGLNFALLSSVFLLWFRSTLAFRLLHRGVDLYDDFTSYEISYVGQAKSQSTPKPKQEHTRQKRKVQPLHMIIIAL